MLQKLGIWSRGITDFAQKKSTFLRFCPYRNQFLTFLWPFSKKKFIFPVCGNRKPSKWALVDVWIFIRSRVILFPEKKRRFRLECDSLSQFAYEQATNCSTEPSPLPSTVYALFVTKRLTLYRTLLSSANISNYLLLSLSPADQTSLKVSCNDVHIARKWK